VPVRTADLRLGAIPRRGLNRVDSAVYIGVSPTKPDEMVKDGRMPKPKRVDNHTLWDIRALDVAFDALPDDADRNPWDDDDIE